MIRRAGAPVLLQAGLVLAGLILADRIAATCPVGFRLPSLFATIALAQQEKAQQEQVQQAAAGGTYLDLLPPAMAPLAEGARRGQPQAAFDVAERFLRGTGIQQNFPAAAHWFQIAAAAGHPGAHNALGRLYSEGLGVERDPVKARSHLTIAADSGDPAFIFDLARFHELAFAETGKAEDATAARDLYALAADKGHVEAMANLGQLYLAGIAVEKDIAKARHYLEKAVEAGNAKAQNNLGLIYVRGDGVERNYDRAAELFQLAAQQGLPTAIRNLGVMYENGFGVKQDDAIATELYKQGARTGGSSIASLIAEVSFFYDPRLKAMQQIRTDPAGLQLAASHGDPIATFLLAAIVSSPEGGGDLKEGTRLMRRAADMGMPAAMANLGILYLRGQGVPQDYVLGYVWLARAVAAGLDDAIELRDALASRLSPEQIAEAQTLAAK